MGSNNTLRGGGNKKVANVNINVVGRGGRRCRGGYWGGAFAYTSLTLLTVSMLMNSQRRRRREPWYLRPGPHPPPGVGPGGGSGSTNTNASGGGGQKKPKEKWPVVLFDFAQCAFCERLDAPAGVDQHVHVVPSSEVDFEFNVWTAPAEDGWHAGLPTTHDSVAALVMLYDVSDKASFELVSKYVGQAERKLTEGEMEGYALLTVVIIGVTDANGGATKRAVTKGEGLKLASARNAFFLEAPCASASNVHDVMISASQEIFSRAAKRRDQELAKDDAMKRVKTAMEGKAGTFYGKTVDAKELETAIEGARQAGCSDLMLKEAKEVVEATKEKDAKGPLGMGLAPSIGNMFIS